jgi:hypothetical protein
MAQICKTNIQDIWTKYIYVQNICTKYMYKLYVQRQTRYGVLAVASINTTALTKLSCEYLNWEQFFFFFCSSPERKALYFIIWGWYQATLQKNDSFYDKVQNFLWCLNRWQKKLFWSDIFRRLVIITTVMTIDFPKKNALYITLAQYNNILGILWHFESD